MKCLDCKNFIEQKQHIVIVTRKHKQEEKTFFMIVAKKLFFIWQKCLQEIKQYTNSSILLLAI